ncbi:hypothetical protein LR032_01185 [Candidatus Bipolaricaulota bacterium]|nr:hypothetical protein [Candidatus Bipolaricaulota bacterium]
MPNRDKDDSKLDLDGLLSLLGTERADEERIRGQILDRSTHQINEAIEEAFPRSGFSHEELFRAGYLGLLSATYNTELAHKKTFSEYAKNLIRGSNSQYWPPTLLAQPGVVVTTSFSRYSCTTSD